MFSSFLSIFQLLLRIYSVLFKLAWAPGHSIEEKGPCITGIIVWWIKRKKENKWTKISTRAKPYRGNETGWWDSVGPGGGAFYEGLWRAKATYDLQRECSWNHTAYFQPSCLSLCSYLKTDTVTLTHACVGTCRHADTAVFFPLG